MDIKKNMKDKSTTGSVLNDDGKQKLETARAYYNDGMLDEAYNALRGLPADNYEVHQLHRALRYEDEARGIVSHVSPEAKKYFADLARRLGIEVKE